MQPQELDDASGGPERRVVPGGDDAPLDAERLQAAPALTDDELGPRSAEDVPAVARQVGRVLLGVGDPGKDLVGQDVFAELGDFVSYATNYMIWEEDCASL